MEPTVPEDVRAFGQAGLQLAWHLFLDTQADVPADDDTQRMRRIKHWHSVLLLEPLDDPESLFRRDPLNWDLIELLYVRERERQFLCFVFINNY
jgi:hypothetical protein